VVYDALRAGASGFLLKDAPEERLTTAIRVVADGGSLFAPSVTRRLIEEFARRSPNQATPTLADLTERETEVLTQVARGRSNAEIAAELYDTENTVKTHVARVLMKLGVRDPVQAVVLAYESGLVRPAGRDPSTHTLLKPARWPRSQLIPSTSGRAGERVGLWRRCWIPGPAPEGAGHRG
jgi:DNA-binding CsgD family transcriptional regulator